MNFIRQITRILTSSTLSNSSFLVSSSSFSIPPLFPASMGAESCMMPIGNDALKPAREKNTVEGCEIFVYLTSGQL